jgi:hypothetical protein
MSLVAPITVLAGFHVSVEYDSHVLRAFLKLHGRRESEDSYPIHLMMTIERNHTASWRIAISVGLRRKETNAPRRYYACAYLKEK